MRGLGRKKKTQKVSLGEKGSFTVRKGALHRALGIPESETIPASNKQIKSTDSPAVKKMKRSALGFAAMKH